MWKMSVKQVSVSAQLYEAASQAMFVNVLFDVLRQEHSFASPNQVCHLTRQLLFIFGFSGQECVINNPVFTCFLYVGCSLLIYIFSVGQQHGSRTNLTKL